MVFAELDDPDIQQKATTWFDSVQKRAGQIAKQDPNAAGNPVASQQATWMDGVEVAVLLLRKAGCQLETESLWCALVHLLGDCLRRNGFGEAEAGLTEKNRQTAMQLLPQSRKLWSKS